MAELIQLRRGDAAEWASANPVLAAGEPGVEVDTGKQKIGNGSTAWADLPYTGGGTAGEVEFTPTGDLAATDAQAALAELDAEKQGKTEKGQPNGYASLGADGKVPTAQLPGSSDNPFPSLLLVEQESTPATPAAGQARLYRSGVDDKLYLVDDAGTVTEVGAGGGGFTPIVKTVRYGVGDLRVPGNTGTSFVGLQDAGGVSIGTTLDLTIPAASIAVGDTIECGASFGYAAQTVDPYISFGSVVNGTVVGSVFTPGGVPGLWATNGQYTNAAGSDFYVVQAGDLAADGSLTVRPLGRTSAAGYRAIMGGGANGNQSVWWVKNWGPQ